MAKDTPLTGRLKIKESKDPGFHRYWFKLEWEASRLQYDWVILAQYVKSLDLSKVVKLAMVPANPDLAKREPASEENGSRWIELTLDSLGSMKTYHISVSDALAPTLLWWLLTSALKHSKNLDLEGALKALPKNRRNEILMHRHLTSFKEKHEIFAATLERSEAEHNEVMKRPGREDYVGEEGVRIRLGESYSKAGGAGGVVYRAEVLVPELTKWAKKIDKDSKDRKLPCVVKVAPVFNDFEEEGKHLLSDQARDLINEAKVMSLLHDYPYVAEILDATVMQRSLMIFIEKGGENLQNFTEPKGVDFQKAYTIATDVLAGLGFMHKRHIVHLDIKPENIVVDDKLHVKLIDFGFARAEALFTPKSAMFEAPQGWHKVGTLGYTPPESWGRSPTKGVELMKRDSYAVGLCFLNALIGKCYDWKNEAKFGEVVDHVRARIGFWRATIQKPENRAKLERDKLLFLADLSLGLIDENVEKRLLVTEAAEQLTRKLQEMHREWKVAPARPFREPKAQPT